MTDSAPVSTRWWCVVAAATAYEALSVAAILLFLPVLVLVVVGVGVGDPMAAMGLSAAGLFLVVPLVLLGMVPALLFPVAIYADAAAVAEADLDWTPDAFLYGLAGAAGLFVGGAPVQPILGLYYLYRRHQHVGTP